MRAHVLAPTLPKAALSVAQKRISEGKLQAAYALYNRVLAGPVKLSETDRLLATYQRGTLAAGLQQNDRAVADLREVLTREPRHFGALSGLGIILQEVGDEKRALDAFRRALAVHPKLERIPDLAKRLADKIDGRGI